MENLQGTILKGYKLEERIGTGGFGAVYRAKQTTIGREVAVKIILPGYANNPDFIRRFESEAHLIARLEHPHITPLYDFWRDPEGAYLVMRFLRNGSIRDALEIEPYELPIVSQLLDQIASGLDFAHRNDVIHRDIKPGNILLDEDGNAYLADFGIAKDLAGITDNKTAVDAVVGSLDYISPEQARSEPVTPRTDIYSLGVTLYEMITVEHPFKQFSSIERLYKHINDPLPEITDLPADLHGVINEIIQKATAKDPEDRYTDVLALALAFRQGIGHDVAQQDGDIVEQLTMREHEVLALIAKGLSNRDIAGELVVSIGTVKWHINSLYKKLAVRSRVQAIVRARELNLIANGHTTDELPIVIGQPVSISLPEPENPYKGLHSFQITDARDFFGRSDLVTKLIDQMQDQDPYHRFIAIVGPSGSGKSSLVKAGLIPALWNGAIPGSEKWYVVDMIPDSRPLDKLEIALMRVSANQSQNLRQQLERDDHGLSRIADLILPGDQTELVIVVDQFEEIFTLVESEATRQQFLDLLRVAVSDVRSRVRVVVTLRADYYDRPLHYPQFGELIRSRMETVLPLSAKGLERAVRGPGERVGVTFEQGLVEQIVSQMNYQAGALPLLQYALTELFDRRQGRLLTNEAYQQIGGAVGALANRAEEVYNGLTKEAQELAHQMFMRLVTLGEGAEDTRRRATQSEMLSLTNNTDLMEEIIDQFAAYRLLSLDHDPETRQPTVEVAHEAILREWVRLRQWLNESREDIRQEQAIGRVATEWEAQEQDTSYLITGSRLDQVENWYINTKLNLTPSEHLFIGASIEERDRRRVADEERKAREANLEQRAINRLRALVSVFATATIIAVILLGLLFNAFNDVETERNNARRISYAAQGQIILQNGQPAEQASLLALNSLELGYSPEADAVLQTALQRNFAVQEFVGHDDVIRHLLISSNGLQMVSVSEDQTARLWNVQTGEELRQFGHGTLITSAGLSDNYKYLATAGTDGTVIIWDTTTGIILHRLSHGDGFTYVGTFSPDDRYILSTDNSNVVRMWDVETGELVHQFESPNSQFGLSKFTTDGRYIVGVGNVAVLWDIETGEIVRRFFGHTDYIIHTNMSQDGQRLITGSRDKTARVWDIETGQEIWRFDHPETVGAVEFSPNGRYALTGGDDGTARIWYLITGEELQRFELPGLVYTTKYLPDGNHIVTAGSDRIIRLWDLDAQTEPLMFAEEFNSSKRGELNLGAELLADNILLISGANAGLRFWQSADDVYVIDHEIAYGEQVADVLVFHPKTNQVVTASNDGVIQLWDANSAELKTTVAGHDGASILNIAFANDGQRIVTVGNDGTTRVWDTTTGEQLLSLIGHDGIVQAARFSPDARMIATAGDDFTVRLWDSTTGDELAIFEAHESIVRDVDFSPDGKYLVSGSHDTTAILWNVETTNMIRQFSGHTDQIWSVRFSPDGHHILTGSADLTARVWDTETGQTVRQLVGHQNSVQSVSFSPDARRIVTSDDQAAYLWYANLDDLINVACSLIPRYSALVEQGHYGLQDVQPVCDNPTENDLNSEKAWTPHPPLPTAIPLKLAPMGEVIEFDFVPMADAFINGMNRPAPDVHILAEDGMVVRAETLDEAVLNAQLYTANVPVPMDFIVPPYDAGPYKKGVPLGFTMGRWLAAKGHGMYTVGTGSATLDMVFENLIPNALYTAWCVRVDLPDAAIMDVPCGKLDGSTNTFVSDADGNATVTIDLYNILQPSTEDMLTAISIAYHSDGRTYGFYSGDLGRVTHQQLVYEFPVE